MNSEGKYFGNHFFGWGINLFLGFPLEVERYEVGVGESPCKQHQKIGD